MNDLADGFIHHLHRLQGIKTVSFDKAAVNQLDFVSPQEILYQARR